MELVRGSSGTVRAGLGADGNRWWLYYRKSADDRFQKVVKRKVTKEEEEGTIERFIPINGSDKGYAVSNARTGRYALYRYDFASDSLGEAIFEHPQVDIEDFSQSDGGRDHGGLLHRRSRARRMARAAHEGAAGAVDKALPGRSSIASPR